MNRLFYSLQLFKSNIDFCSIPDRTIENLCDCICFLVDDDTKKVIFENESHDLEELFFLLDQAVQYYEQNPFKEFDIVYYWYNKLESEIEKYYEFE